MMSFKHVAMIGFIFICFISATFSINQSVKNADNHQFQSTIEDRATTIGFLSYDQGNKTFSNLSALQNYANHFQYHMTLYSNSGKQLFSNMKQTLTFEQTKQPSFKKIGDTFQYTSPLKMSGNTIGTIVLNGNVPSNHGLFFLDFVIALVGIIVIFIYVQFIRNFTRPLEEATKMAEALASGDYKKRTYEDHPFDFSGRLGRSLNELARNLERTSLSYEEQKDRLRTLIDNLGSSLIFIDDFGRINLVNTTFRKTFHIEKNNWYGEDYHDVIAYEEIIEIIDETIMMESNLKRELGIYIHIEKKYFDVYSAPILDSKKHFRGVILVFHDITDLKELEQVRKDFVANVSHELKTPITSISGFAETLLDGANQDQEILEQFLSIIHKESLRLQELIHDLLELSKLEQDNVNINWSDVDLKQLLTDTLLILQEKANAKEITMTVQAEKPALISGDTERIRQVMINLMSNAIAYTPAKGHIWLSLVTYPHFVQFVVRDTGIGIPEREIPRIFERFYRVDKARSRNSGGTGLGLAIVKHIVEAHEGTINVQSKLNEGTTFTITFFKEAPNNLEKGKANG